MYNSKIFLGKNAAVATEHPLASLAAVDTLRAGGNAVDAAITASTCLAVTQPQLNGLGGDFFALYYDTDSRQVHCLNASGWAPTGLTIDTLRSKGLQAVPLFGPYSTVVPGYVSGIINLHKRFGRKEFAEDLASAIKLAEDGFLIYPALSSKIQEVLGELSASAKKLFAPSNQPLIPGALLRQQGLARTLREITAKGTSAFYEGRVFENIANALAEDGPEVRLEDFKSYQPEWPEPLKMEYMDSTLYEMPPNSMGATSFLILNSLRALELNRLQPDSRERIETTFKVVRDAYAKMWEQLGDPRFTNINMHDYLSPDRARMTKAISGPTSHNADTTYFAVVDKEGNIVSGIQSLFHHFGSRVYVEDCGFLTNRASAFKFDGPNKLQPRKRPLHTLSALLVAEHGEMRAAIGTSGAEYRPQQHALFLTNYLDYHMTLEEALAYPRFLWASDKITIETGYKGLEQSEFNEAVVAYPERTGVAHAIEITNGVKKAVCDIRGEGLPLGL